MSYAQHFGIIVGAIFGVLLGIFLGIKYLNPRQIIEDHKKSKEGKIRKQLFEELFSHGIWWNDYGEENELRHGKVAKLLGIIPEVDHNSFEKIATALNIKLACQPFVQDALCIRMCNYLGITADEEKVKERGSDSKEWKLIAEKIGVKDFEKRYGKELPIPFIMHAFCELFCYLEKLST